MGKGLLALHPAQQDVYRDQLINSESPHYNIGGYIRLMGSLDVGKFQQAILTAADIFDAFKLRFGQNGAGPGCYIDQQFVKSPIEIIDFTGAKNPVEDAHLWIKDRFSSPFLINEATVPFEEYLLQLNSDEYWFYGKYHQLIIDGYGFVVFINYLASKYKALVEGNTPEFNVLSYTAEIENRAAYTNSQAYELDKKFWENKLANYPPRIFSPKYMGEAKIPQANSSILLELSHDQQKAFRSLQASTGCSIQQLIIAVLIIYLGKTSEQSSLVFGIPLHKRSSGKSKDIVGAFAGIVPFIGSFEEDKKLIDLLKEINNSLKSGYRHLNYPGGGLSGYSSIDGRQYLYDVIIGYEALSFKPDFGFGIQADVQKVLPNGSTNPLSISLLEYGSNEALQLQIQFANEYFQETEVELLARRIIFIIEQFPSRLDKAVGSIDLLPPSERSLLYGFNERATNYPNTKSIVDIFEEVVENHPDQIALTFSKQQYTYRQLNELSNQLGHYLVQKGVKPGTLVPLFLDRSAEMIISILSIIKAGAAYVPVDPAYPSERINYMLRDIAASIIVSTLGNQPLFEADGTCFIELDSEWQEILKQPATNLQTPVSPQSLAYVIYTSGSTGKPKGTMIEHANVVSLVKNIDYVSLTEHTTILSTGSPSFDATTFEYWGILLNGGRLVICKEDTLLDNHLLSNEITNHKVTTMWFTSSWFNQLAEYDIAVFKNLQTILVGGEKLSEQHIQKFRQVYPGIEIINGYGPTENTTFSLTHKITETNITGPIPIGRPLNNRTAYVVDKHGRLAPIGVAGEVWLGGAGLARGYLNQAELTAQKFILNPFGNDAEERLYKTGDRGRWIPTGILEYINRIDDQVKVRGYRIELGEVETALNKLASVNNSCVVVKRDENSTARLVGYYIPDWQIFKTKERELYTSLVAGWKELYETEYAKTELANDIDPEFNIIGWNDSFTGEPIPAEQMREWLHDIVDVILSEKPGSVLEIGTGTGLIYYQLAGKLEKYFGTDFSRSSINQVTDQISKGLRNYGPTELSVCAAHEVSLKSGERIDTIILNSIIQYFPGEGYMTDVISNSIFLLKGKGRIIVGDVRDNRLLESFKGLLLLKKLPGSMPLKDFKWLLEQEVLKEEELCFSPDYFYRLKSQFPQITHVEIKWKQASYINELSLYRFTVIIYVGIEEPVIRPEWEEWDLSHEQQIFTQLKQGNRVAIKGVPSPRVWKERALSNELRNKSLNTTGELQGTITREDDESIKVNEFLAKVQEQGYTYRLLPDEDIFNVNLLLEPVPSKAFIEQPYTVQALTSNTASTNIPLFTDISALLQKEIRKLLLQSLPEYMVPAEMIALRQFPLTNNGKADRNFLSSREEGIIASKHNFQAPQTAMECSLAKVWQELLNKEHIGIHDDFFEMGGHSLLAMRLVSAINQQLNVGLTMKDLFFNPSICQLGRHLETANNELYDNFKSLIQIKEATAKTGKIPLYMVCGGGGTVFKFKEFADMLAPDQPVFGLQQPVEIRDLKEFPETIEGIAARYIDEISSQDPEGPYALSGHCLGGIIAYEMAKQLKAAGKEIKLLALFDTIIGESEMQHTGLLKKSFLIPHSLKKAISKLFLKLNFEFYLFRKYTRYALSNKLTRLKSLSVMEEELMDTDVDLKVFKKLEKIFLKAYKEYQISPYDGDIIAFYAKEHYYFWDKENNVKFKRLILDEDTKNMWRQYVRTITMYEVEGEHSTIFYPVNGKEFAQLVQGHLDRCMDE